MSLWAGLRVSLAKPMTFSAVDCPTRSLRLVRCLNDQAYAIREVFMWPLKPKNLPTSSWPLLIVLSTRIALFSASGSTYFLTCLNCYPIDTPLSTFHFFTAKTTWRIRKMKGKLRLMRRRRSRIRRKLISPLRWLLVHSLSSVVYLK